MVVIKQKTSLVIRKHLMVFTHGEIRHRLFVLVVCFFLLSLNFLVPLESVDAFKPTYHGSLTERALKDISVQRVINGERLYFTQAAIDQIIAANKATDCLAGVCSGDLPEYHFDNEKFYLSSKRLMDMKKTAADNLNETSCLNSGRLGCTGYILAARKNLGTALHTVQDFYAHTNWVELTLKGIKSGIDTRLGKEIIPDYRPDQFFATSPVNNPGKYLDTVTQLTSGYFQPALEKGWSGVLDRLCVNVPPGKTRHGVVGCPTGLNKDNEGRPNFDTAYNLALKASIDYVNQMLDAPGIKGNTIATKALMGLNSNNPPPPPPTTIPPPSDSDHDGVPDNAPDQCPDTPPNQTGSVDSTGCVPLKIKGLAPTPLTACVQYEGRVTASDGKPGYTFTGTAPKDLQLLETGMVTGKPRNVGENRLLVTVKDARGVLVSEVLTFQVNAPTINLNPASGALPNGKVNTPYSQQISASGSSEPYSFAVTADVLPDGLSLNTNGLISGTPSRSAGGKTFDFTITATDLCNSKATARYSIMIEEPPPDGDGDGVFDSTPDLCPNTPAGSSVDAQGCIPLNLGDLQPAQATACQPYNGTIAASDGIPGYTFSGTAPRGLQLMANGSISGVPLDAGSNPFSVTVTDMQPISASGTLILQVNAPTIQLSPTGELPMGRVGTSYAQQLTASGSKGSYSFAVTEGVLPDGLSLYGNGLIAGTPTSRNHTDGFTITAMDACGYKGSAQYRISIEETVREGYNYDALGSSDPFVYGRVCTDVWFLTYQNQTLMSSECSSSCRTPDVYLPPFEPVWRGSCVSRPGQ